MNPNTPFELNAISNEIIRIKGEKERLEKEIADLLAKENAQRQDENSKIASQNNRVKTYLDFLIETWTALYISKDKEASEFFASSDSTYRRLKDEEKSIKAELDNSVTRVNSWTYAYRSFRETRSDWENRVRFTTTYAVMFNIRIKVSRSNVVLAPGFGLPGIYPDKADSLKPTIFHYTYPFLHPYKYAEFANRLKGLSYLWDKYVAATQELESASPIIGYKFTDSEADAENYLKNVKERYRRAKANLDEYENRLKIQTENRNFANAVKNAGCNIENVSNPEQLMPSQNLRSYFYERARRVMDDATAKLYTDRSITISSVRNWLASELQYAESPQVAERRRLLKGLEEQLDKNFKQKSAYLDEIKAEYPAIHTLLYDTDGKSDWRKIAESQRKHKSMLFLYGWSNTEPGYCRPWMVSDKKKRRNYNLRQLNDSYSEKDLRDIFQLTLGSIIGHINPHYLKVTIVDFPAKGYHKPLFNPLVELGQITTIITPEALGHKIKELETKIEVLYNKYTDAVAEYNDPYSTATPDYEVIVVIGPERMLCSEHFANIIEKGPQFGIFVLGLPISASGIKTTGDSKTIEQCLENLYINNNSANKNFKSIIENICEYTAKSFKSQQNKSIYWPEMQQRINSFNSQLSKKIWDDSTNGLVVPIGLDTDNCEDAFYFNNDQFLSLVIGQTGSGKSVFLHTLITNMILKYSPSQVQLHLMDFKDAGLEFRDYVGAPHVKNILLDGSDKDMALSILDDITNLLHKNSEIMKEANCNDIYQYNQRHPQAPLPFNILVVDECHNLFAHTLKSTVSDRISDAITKLAREGRASGIGFIMATQTLEGVDMPKAVQNQLNNAYILNCSAEDYSRIFPNDKKHREIPAYHVFHKYINNGNNKVVDILTKVYNIREEKQELSYTAKLRKKAFNSTSQFCYNGTIQLELSEDIVRRAYDMAHASKYNPVLSIGHKLIVDLPNANAPIKFSTNTKSHLLVSGINSDGQTDRIMLNGLWSLMKYNPSNSPVYILNGNNQDNIKFESLDKDLSAMCSRSSLFHYATNAKGIRALIEELYAEYRHRSGILEQDPDAVFSPIVIANLNHSVLMNRFSENTTFTVSTQANTEDIQRDSLRSERAAALSSLMGGSESTNIFDTIGGHTSSFSQNRSSKLNADKTISYPEALAEILAKGSELNMHLILQTIDTKSILPDYACRNIKNTNPDSLFNYQVYVAKDKDPMLDAVSAQLDKSINHLRVYLRALDNDSCVIAPYKTPSLK